METPSKETSSIPLPSSVPHTYDVPPLTGLAVVSLVLGILSLMSALLLIPALCAVITGHMAIHKIRHANRDLGGHRLAVTGMIMGYVSIMLFSLLMVTAFFLWPKFGPEVKGFLAERQLAESMRNASELYLVCERYARDHNDTYPAQWQDLEKGYSNKLDLKKWLGNAHTDDPAFYPAFDLVKHERPVFESAKHRVAVLQERAPPNVEQVVVVYADGHSEPTPNPAHE